MMWWGLAAVLLVAGALIPAGWSWHRSRMDAANARARACYDELGYAVQTTTTSDLDSQRALHRARERWNSAGAVLAQANCDADYRIAERTAREGLDILPTPTATHTPRPEEI